jgi:phosphoribosylaminoimidazole-succinocarboxamide synthase
MFELDGQLLMVATDRISAFDVILPNAIPQKGKVLTQLSAFWFEQLEGMVSHHLISVRVDEFPAPLQPFRKELAGRSMLVRKCTPLPIECVVRGYLAGSGWAEYQQSETICGIRLPSGLVESSELPEPIFTPSTKATTGHDENISFDRAAQIIGPELAEQVRDLSLSVYSRAREYALEKGIIICDTKFEFGMEGSRLLLIDEVLTPDSSRFWPKQFIRDFLETLDWDKAPPGPELSSAIVEATSKRYVEVYRRLTGKDLDEAL